MTTLLFAPRALVLPEALSLWDSLGFSVVTVALVLGLALLLSSYVKIVTVLAVVRVGIGVNSLPSAFVTGGLAVVLSFFVMFPTINRATSAMDGVLKQNGNAKNRAVEAALDEWKVFLVKHAHESELNRFVEIASRLESKEAETGELAELRYSWRVVAPAFVVSELKEAFATGLSIFLPFLIIDLLIANILTAVGLAQVSPILVAFPFKLLLFVMVDGWTLITTHLVATYL